jgi:DNA-binding transcriptional LysR family regulator
MMARPSLDDLAAFACVARLRSFTRAAAELGTSTSNLSYRMKRLEGALGSRLLQRNSRSVRPSEAGERMLETLAPALRSIDGAVDDLGQGAASVAGTLRLTATRHAYQQVIRPVLARFTAQHPNATVEVMIDYAFRDIIADGFDAGIRLGEKLSQDMIALKVGPDLRMAVVASPSYIASRGAPDSPTDLTAHRCINYRMVAADTIYAWEFERAGRTLQVRVPGPLTFNDPDPMLECALEGLGIAYVLLCEAEPHIAAGRLTLLLPDWTPAFPGFHLYYPSRHLMRPVLAAFIESLRRRPARSAREAPGQALAGA